MDDIVRDVETDDLGNIYMTGETSGSMDPKRNIPGVLKTDTFVKKLEDK